MLACVFSCRKDQIEDDLSVYTPPVGQEFATEIRGTVFDRALDPIAQTKVTIGDKVTKTDDYGHFIIRGTSASEDGSLISFDHPEYFKSHKFVFPTEGGASNVHVLMNPRMTFTEFDAAQGGQPTSNISFPPNAVVDENGDPYNGKVHVYSFYMNTDAPNFNYQIPGDLRGEDINGNQIQLGTFGMWTVELETPDGSPLQLGNGQKATLDFRIAPDILAAAPAEIPLWHFDENTGFWMEEGTATLNGNKYDAEVSHFSTWNCDIPFPKCKMRAVFINENGAPLVNYPVIIKEVTGLLVASSVTNSLGIICGSVPLDVTIQITVLNNCGMVLYQELHDITEGNCDLGKIEVNTLADIILFSGKILNCASLPLTNGYAVVSIDDTKDQILYPDENGIISGFIDHCNKEAVDIKIVDFENIEASNLIEVTLITPSTEFGIISTCDDLADDFLTLKTNNLEEFAFDQKFEAFIVDDSEIIILGVTSMPGPYILASIPFMDEGAAAPTYFRSLQYDPQTNSNLPCNCYGGGSINFPCENNIVATILSNDGETITGSIVGSGKGPNQGELVNIDVTFKVKLGEPSNRVDISGTTWLDENENGIQDDPVNDPIKVEKGYTPFIAYGSSPLIFPDVVHTFNDNGSYLIENAIVRDRFDLVLDLPIQWIAAPLLQGDDTNDNNFESLSSTTTVRNFRTNLSSDSQLDLSYIDLGLIPSTSQPLIIDTDVLGCAEFAIVTATVAGGTPPYTYSWPAGAQSNSVGQLTNMAPGIYSVTVEDNNGTSATGSWEIPEANNKLLVKAFHDKNGNNYYDGGIDSFLENVRFSIEQAGSTTNPAPLIEGVSDQNGDFIFENMPYITTYLIKAYTPDGFEIIESQVGPEEIDNDFHLTPNSPTLPPLATEFYMDCETTKELWAGFKEL